MAIKWVDRWRQTGSAAAKQMGGYKRSPLDDQADVVLGILTERPDLTVEEIRAALRGCGLFTGHGSVRRFFKRHGISFKKNRAGQRAGPAGRGCGTQKVAQGSARV